MIDIIGHSELGISIRCRGTCEVSDERTEIGVRGLQTCLRRRGMSLKIITQGASSRGQKPLCKVELSMAILVKLQDKVGGTLP